MKKMFSQRYFFTQYFDLQLTSHFLIPMNPRAHLCLTIVI